MLHVMTLHVFFTMLRIYSLLYAIGADTCVGVAGFGSVGPHPTQLGIPQPHISIAECPTGKFVVGCHCTCRTILGLNLAAVSACLPTTSNYPDPLSEPCVGIACTQCVALCVVAVEVARAQASCNN
jgi:hypothetical protein